MRNKNEIRQFIDIAYPSIRKNELLQEIKDIHKCFYLSIRKNKLQQGIVIIPYDSLEREVRLTWFDCHNETVTDADKKIEFYQELIYFAEKIDDFRRGII